MNSEIYFQLGVQKFIKMFSNLQKCLDKLQIAAENKKYEVVNVLNARLAPDQYPFIRQIQITSDTAKLFASRVSGKEAPVFEDKKQTLEEVRERIKKTVSYLQTFKASDFNGAETRKIVLPWMKDKFLTSEDYFRDFVIPNFYFHFMTAYSILRHNGVDVGKADYIGELPFHSA